VAPTVPPSERLEIFVRFLHQQSRACGRAASADTTGFEHSDAYARLGKTPRDCGTSDPAADDGDINGKIAPNLGETDAPLSRAVVEPDGGFETERGHIVYRSLAAHLLALKA
jgi:hypothetical protein